MQHSKILAVTLSVAALATPMSADGSWDGFYAGLSLDATRSKAGISGTAAHDRNDTFATLGAYGGFNRTTQRGLIWGGEIGISGLPSGANASGGGLGTSEFKGKYLITPRLRAGFATDKVFFYGIAGLGISDAVVRRAGATSTDVVIGVNYGLGAEMKLGNNWSTRLDITRTDLGIPDQSFGAQKRDTKVKIDKITFGLTKNF
ncbi:porin family protein [Planktotalea sp.]|uniref:porin family protein n=1 Tax=Planktotalea sp. TaxID=2029877 RepID=UPI003D6A02BE